MKCERCKKNHDGSFGSGRFCSKHCANQRIYTEEIKQKISVGVNKDNFIKGKQKGWKTYHYICEKCNNGFETKNKIRKRRHNHCHCNGCKRKVVKNIINPETILEFSKRTICKIFKRAGIGCSICGWKEAACDIHHIIEKKNNGNNDMGNLIILCPNCHRKAHSKLFNIDDLYKFSMDKIFANWKDFYNINYKAN